MRLSIQRVLRKLGNVLIYWSHKLAASSREKMVTLWFHDRGNQTKRLDYDLNEASVVFDIGGYEGQWASDIFSKYCCIIYVFEPVKAYYEFIHNRFERNDRIIVHPFGLADKSETAFIFLDKDSSSLYRRSMKVEQVQLVRAIDFIEQNQISSIDLMKINIEGGEYELLEHLIACGFIIHIKNIQIQFHDFVDDAEKRMREIHNQLEKTHHLTYHYPFVWENWEYDESKG